MRYQWMNLCDHLEIPDYRIDFDSLASKKHVDQVVGEFNATNPCVIINSIFERFCLRYGYAGPKAPARSANETPVKPPAYLQTPQTAKTEELAYPIELPLLKEHDSLDDSKPQSVHDETPAVYAVKSEPVKVEVPQMYPNLMFLLDTIRQNDGFQPPKHEMAHVERRPLIRQVKKQIFNPFDEDVFSYNTKQFTDEPIIKQVAVSKEQVRKAIEICSYLKSYQKMQNQSELHCLKVLDSLRILSDYLGVQGSSVHDLIYQILRYFQAVFGQSIVACEGFYSAQLHEACLDYVRLGYVTLHYRHVAAVK